MDALDRVPVPSSSLRTAAGKSAGAQLGESDRLIAGAAQSLLLAIRRA
jgi:hypothetical protein